MTENRDRLRYIAEKLIAEETLEGEKLEKLFTEPIPPPGTGTAATEAKKPETQLEEKTQVVKTKKKVSHKPPEPGTAMPNIAPA